MSEAPTLFYNETNNEKSIIAKSLKIALFRTNSILSLDDRYEGDFYFYYYYAKRFSYGIIRYNKMHFEKEIHFSHSRHNNKQK